MKISKVDHTRAAVSVNKEDSSNKVSGILYHDPSKKNEQSIDLNARFNKLNNSAKGLYNFFNTVQVGTEPTAPDEGSSELKIKNYPTQKKNYELRVSANKFIGGIDGINAILSRCFIDKKNKCIKNVDAVISSIRQESQVNDPALVDSCLSLYLRKSLNPQKENVRIAILSLGKEINDDQKKAISELVGYLNRDYSKETFSKNVIKSIKNQNLVIQPDPDGKFGIAPVNDSGKKGTSKGRKKSEKDGIDRMLTQYADLDKNKRDELLCRLRNLLDLYFSPVVSGIEDDIDDRGVSFNVWGVHEKGKSAENLFVNIPPIIIDGSDGKHKQDAVVLGNEIDDLNQNIRKKNIECYRNACEKAEKNIHLYFSEMNINKFWIHHFENAVERVTKNFKPEKAYKLKVGVLREKVWKDAINFLCIKYIAIGKEVFNFGMQGLLDGEISHMKLGEVPANIKDGISSFDYEMIKANETLQREVAVAVSFAANNLSRATVDVDRATEEENKTKDMSDFLLWKKDEITKYRLFNGDGETTRSILQFFGGNSLWNSSNDKGFNDALKEKYVSDDYESEFLFDLKDIIYSLRNENFHFTTANVNKGEWNTEIIGSIFEKEAKACVSYERDKFYSNNLPMFYSDENLRKTLDFLYKKESKRASQISAFNTVFVRKKFPGFLKTDLGINVNYELEDKEKWTSAFYYLCKEIYYNAFISDDETMKSLFYNALRSEYSSFFDNETYQKNKSYKENINILLWNTKNFGGDKRKASAARATADFLERYDALKNNSFSFICQAFMTEYNYQNNNRKVKSSDDSKMNEDIFRHYVDILNSMIKKAFAEYVKKEESLKFILLPSNTPKEKSNANDFLSDWTSNKYASLTDKVKNKPVLQKWYITGKFLNGKMLNQLVGTLRSYIRYFEDIERRAKETGNSIYIVHEDKEYLDDVISVIELCIRLSGKYSNNIEDYFASKEAYADYLADYLDFNGINGNTNLEKLFGFCAGLDSDNRIYVDEINPIPNRNVIMSKLYGPGNVLKNAISKITVSDIEGLKESKAKIEEYRNTGECSTKNDQKNVLRYQGIKNKVEFRDYVEYGEIVNELLGQLINGSYLRERDLLYFQIGYHYMCLNNPDCTKFDGYEVITDNNGNVLKNAILYQISSMYINGLPIFGKKDNTYILDEEKSGMATSGKIGKFLKYSSVETYLAGLELFEVIDEHDQVIDLRNKIDHFKYYSKKSEASLLDLYSEVFDRFFTYDMKYQKNVINMMENILLHHHVIFVPKIGTKENGKAVGEKEIKYKNMAYITIPVNGIASDEFTYAIGGKKEYLPAKSFEFLRDIALILCYPAPIQQPDDLIRVHVERKDVKPINDPQSSTKKNGYKDKAANRSSVYNIKKCKKCGKELSPVIGGGYCEECSKERPKCSCGKKKAEWINGDWGLCYNCLKNSNI